MLSHVLLPTIVALSIVLMLVRPRGIPEVFYWIGGGALLLIALRLVPLHLAGKAVAEGDRCPPLPDRHDAAVRTRSGAWGLRLALLGCSAKRKQFDPAAIHSRLRNRYARHDLHVERCHRRGADIGDFDGCPKS